MKTLTLLFLLAASLNAYGEIMNLTVGALIWGTSYSGNVKRGKDSINLENDLDLNSHGNGIYFLNIDFPADNFPDIRIQQTDLETNSKIILNRDIDFGGTTFPGNGTAAIDANFDFSHLDITIYNTLYGQYGNVALGITARSFNAEVALSEDTLGSESLKFDESLPMFFLGLEFKLSPENFSLKTDFNWVAWDDQIDALDYSLYVDHTSKNNIGIVAGWRSFSAQGKKSINSRADIKANGGFFGIHYAF